MHAFVLVAGGTYVLTEYIRKQIYYFYPAGSLVLELFSLFSSSHFVAMVGLLLLISYLYCCSCCY